MSRHRGCSARMRQGRLRQCVEKLSGRRDLLWEEVDEEMGELSVPVPPTSSVEVKRLKKESSRCSMVTDESHLIWLSDLLGLDRY